MTANWKKKVKYFCTSYLAAVCCAGSSPRQSACRCCWRYCPGIEPRDSSSRHRRPREPRTCSLSSETPLYPEIVWQKTNIKHTPTNQQVRNRIPEAKSITPWLLQKKALIVYGQQSLGVGGRSNSLSMVPFSDFLTIVWTLSGRTEGKWCVGPCSKRDDGDAPRDTSSPLWVQARGMAKNIARLTTLAKIGRQASLCEIARLAWWNGCFGIYLREIYEWKTLLGEGFLFYDGRVSLFGVERECGGCGAQHDVKHIVSDWNYVIRNFVFLRVAFLVGKNLNRVFKNPILTLVFAYSQTSL